MTDYTDAITLRQKMYREMQKKQAEVTTDDKQVTDKSVEVKSVQNSVAKSQPAMLQSIDTTNYETADKLANDAEYGGTETNGEVIPSIDELRKSRKQQKVEATSKIIEQKDKKIEKTVTYIKELPTSVVVIAQKVFPLLTKRDAIIAYIFALSGEEMPDDISENIFKAVEEYKKDKAKNNPLISIAKTLKLLNDKAVLEDKRNRTLELGIAYLVSDRMGYRKEAVNDPKKVNMLEEDVLAFLERYRNQSMQLIVKENVQKG